jgi:ATP-dependent Clp protease ATP-binding subunit ClpB
VDFTNSIIVMTSNIGSHLIQKITEDGGSQDEIREAVENALRNRFTPELLNRIDEKIVFQPLRRDQIGRIVVIQLKALEKRLGEQGLSLEVTDRARHAIAEEGYDPTFGARPLKRVIQQRIANRLATELLKGELRNYTGVQIDYEDGDFTFVPVAEGEVVSS